MQKTTRPFTKGSIPGAFVITLAALALTGIVFAAWWTFVRERTPASPSPQKAAQNKALAGRKITCLVDQRHARAFHMLAEWFYEETGAVVRNIVVPCRDMLVYAEKDPASLYPQLDLMVVHYQSLGILTEKHILADLTDFIEEHKDVLQPEDYLPALYDVFSEYGGKRWALPLDGGTHFLFYRKSLLEKYGFSPPETWDAYLEIARTITEHERTNGIYGTAIVMHPFTAFCVSSYMDRLGSYGGALLDADHHPAVNSPEALTALTALVEQAKYALPHPRETDFDVSRDAFLAGKVAMVEQWTDIGIMAKNPAQSLIQDDWGVVPLPMGSGPSARRAAPLNSGFSLAISSKAPDLDTARAFLLFASQPDIPLRLLLNNLSFAPMRTSVLQSEQYRRFAPEMSTVTQEALVNPIPWLKSPREQELLDILADHLLLALAGNESPQQALDATQARWIEILRK